MSARKILVSGSRGWSDKRIIREALPKGGNVTVVHGGALGADQLASEVAQERGFAEWVFTPDWEGLGRKAGPIRNRNMLEQTDPDEVLVFWDGKSRGTKNMLDLANRAGYPVQLFVDTEAQG